MKNKEEIIADKNFKYLFLVYLSPLLIINGLTGLLRGKAILRYITIEGPIGIFIDIIYIGVATFFFIMFTYNVVSVIRKNVSKNIIAISLFVLTNLLLYILCILYVIDEYYSFLIVKNLFTSAIIWMVLILMYYTFITITIYYVFRLIKIIK